VILQKINVQYVRGNHGSKVGETSKAPSLGAEGVGSETQRRWGDRNGKGSGEGVFPSSAELVPGELVSSHKEAIWWHVFHWIAQ